MGQMVTRDVKQGCRQRGTARLCADEELHIDLAGVAMLFDQGPGQEGVGSLSYLMMTHWFSQSMSMFRYMLSVRA